MSKARPDAVADHILEAAYREEDFLSEWVDTHLGSPYGRYLRKQGKVEFDRVWCLSSERDDRALRSP